MESVVDMEPLILPRQVILGLLGRFLFSGGVILACFAGIRMAHQAVEGQVVAEANYALIHTTPEFELPPATQLPTVTPSPTPTAPPPALPAIRLSIPSINLNSSIKEIEPTEKVLRGGAVQLSWEPLAYVVAHYETSGNPGEGRNIVLTGHNNTLGSVFRSLDKIELGDQLTLYTEMQAFEYKVQKKFIIPYLGVEADGDQILQSYAAPQTSEMVTMISCWPYATNANRIVIIAVPVDVKEGYGG